MIGRLLRLISAALFILLLCQAVIAGDPRNAKKPAELADLGGDPVLIERTMAILKGLKHNPGIMYNWQAEHAPRPPQSRATRITEETLRASRPFTPNVPSRLSRCSSGIQHANTPHLSESRCVPASSEGSHLGAQASYGEYGSQDVPNRSTRSWSASVASQAYRELTSTPDTNRIPMSHDMLRSVIDARSSASHSRVGGSSRASSSSRGVLLRKSVVSRSWRNTAKQSTKHPDSKSLDS
jgi:hypothetical protein